MPKVFVSGCYDLLHSGHIAFFKEAAQFGDLYVALGSDRTVTNLKGRPPINTEEERLFMVQSVSYVKQAFISKGDGMLDFLDELMEIQPDFLIVNEDGNIPEKRQLCKDMGIQYLVLKREPHEHLIPRSTTALRSVCTIPFRIDVAGGWLDQPWVSMHFPGPVITISLEPTIEFNDRSGMASSTRASAIDLWGPRLPPMEYEKQAKILFCYDNPPGTEVISGSQDAIGIVFPGLTKANYNGKYWPESIDSVQDEETLQFIEQALYLIPLGPRQPDFNVLENTRIDRIGAKALSDAAEGCWKAMLNHNIHDFGKYMRLAYEAQILMFPNMINSSVTQQLQLFQDQALGWKLSGAGGGGYLIFVADHPIKDAIRTTIRRKS